MIEEINSLSFCFPVQFKKAIAELFDDIQQ